MNLIEELSKIKGCRFVHLLYESKETQELSEYSLAMGVRLEKAYRRDDKVMRLVRPKNELEEKAKSEILSSLQESLRAGIGYNSAYTCKGVFHSLFPGCKYHHETKIPYLYGFVIRKKVIRPGAYKAVKSKPLTLIKQAMRRKMKISRFRQFALDHVKRISFNGKILSLE